MEIKCLICKEENPKLLQEHHWRYKPEKKGILCIECHKKQHNHGVGKGKLNQKDILFLKYSLKKKRRMSTEDFNKFYYSCVFRAIKKLRDLGLLMREGYSEYPSFYSLNIEKAKRTLGLGVV